MPGYEFYSTLSNFSRSPGKMSYKKCPVCQVKVTRCLILSKIDCLSAFRNIAPHCPFSARMTQYLNIGAMKIQMFFLDPSQTKGFSYKVSAFLSVKNVMQV
jgi:hypothetical protein